MQTTVLLYENGVYTKRICYHDHEVEKCLQTLWDFAVNYLIVTSVSLVLFDLH